MSTNSWRTRLEPKPEAEEAPAEDLLANKPRPSGMRKKPRLLREYRLDPDATVAQLGRIVDGEHDFPCCPRFEQNEWDLSTTDGGLDLETIVRLVRGKPPVTDDAIRYISVSGLSPRSLASFKTPVDNFEEHCSIVVDTDLCDPRSEEARDHWRDPATAKCFDEATLKVVT